MEGQAYSTAIQQKLDIAGVLRVVRTKYCSVHRSSHSSEPRGCQRLQQKSVVLPLVKQINHLYIYVKTTFINFIFS
ncbi:hypothetical protein P3S68_026742 [Capsicum galapagoense]